jgi:hypothetical protein
MNAILFIILFLVAFFERVVFDFGPNVELVTACLLLASAYLGKKHAILLTFSVLFVTDIILGTTSIFIFTWTGFLIPVIISSNLFRKRRNKGIKKVFIGSALGISTTLFFFVWTNFGVWLLDTWGMYPDSLAGLTLSYINAIPFLKLHILSTLLFVPLGFTLFEVSKKILIIFHPKALLLQKPHHLFSERA